MKKVLAFALVALAVTAAQAVTVSWSGTGAESATYGMMPGTLSFADADYFQASIRLGNISALYSNANFSASSTNFPDMVTITNGDAKTLIDVNFKKSGGYKLLINNNEALLGIHTSDVVITFTASKTNDTWSAITWSVPGATSATNTTLTAHTGTLSGVSVADFSDTLLGVSLGGKVGNTALGTVTVEVANVPEPTALALLALGVAGLALKRKVA